MARVLAWTNRVGIVRRGLAALIIAALMLACQDDGPTGLLKRPGAPSRSLTAPAVEFYVHSSVEDWPVFMGNVAITSVQSGHKVTFVITTAGDAGKTATYWKTRESAGLASIDSIVGAGTWTCGSQVVNAHPLRRCAKANVVVFFMRMPDGNYYDGSGYGYGSLSNLRDKGTPTQPIDQSTTYITWADFTNTVQGIVTVEAQGAAAASVLVSAPDYDRSINPRDHPDNAATADAVHAATQAMGWTLAFYVDYQTENMPVNLTQAEHDAKQRIFLAYDRVMVAAHYSSDANDPDITQWLWRTYYRVSSPVPPDAPSALTAIASSKGRIDLQWTGNSGTASGYYVERAPDVAGGAGTYAQIGNVPGNTTSYSDLSVAPGTAYWYRVRAYNDGGTSAYSNAATTTTPTSQPLPYRGDAYIIAHADDWQIFAGDHAYASFENAAAMLFIYTTAGDGGSTTAYWKQREKGALASMDAMLGSGSWACANKTIRTHPIWRCTKSTTVVYFMRMPDGNYIDGTGYGYGSLSNLRSGTPTTALDGSTTYTTWSDFYSTIGAIVDLELDGQSSPYVKVKAQEYDKTRDPNDHPDHNTTGDAVRLAASTHSWDLEYFIGYDTENRAVNITDTQHSQKLLVWTPYDNTMVAGGYPSDLNDPEYQAWVWRTYFRSIAGSGSVINAPSGLRATTISQSEIDLAWTDNSTNETSFNIERAPDNAGTPGTYTVVGSVGANVTSFANTALPAGTTYWYRVQALNSTGVSSYSNAISGATQQPPPPPPPVAPSGLVASVASSSQINLTWTDNSGDETGFTIERAPDIAGGAGTFAVIGSVGANVTSYASTGLTGGTTYWYRVQAFNANGNSSYSNTTSATTASVPPPPPAAPSNLVVGGATSSQLSLSWTDNADNEGGFSIERAPDNGGTPGTYAVLGTVAANVTSYTNTGLAAATTYWYRVQAFNANGNSAYSNAASGTTAPPPPPAAPTALGATAVSSTQINLSWTDNANDESGFNIERAADNGGVPGTYTAIATVGANVTSFGNTGLAPSTTYWYRVQAFSANGTSAYSNAASSTTATPPPAAPTALAAAAVSVAQINLSWTDNATNETGYRIERAPDAAGAAGTYTEIATVGAGATTYSNTGLTSGTTYWYRVRAYNGSGTSSYSNEASATTPLIQPAAPTGLAATATSSTSIALSWTDNASNETGYLVERAPDAGGIAGAFAQVASLAANSTAWTDASVASSTTYWYRVRAAGQLNSDYSNTTFATTPTPPPPPTPPNAPSNLVPQVISTTEIDLAWTDNSLDETSFTVQRAPDAGGVPGTYATIATLGANVTSYKNTGLTASTTYWYRVRADNAAGSSAWIAASSTTLSGPPAAPTTLAAKPTNSALTASLTWKDNATNETGFRIEQAPDNNGVAGAFTEIATVGANVASYTVSGLTGFTKYWFRVRAYNGAGTSSYSNQASVVTSLPTDLTVDPVSGNGQLAADVEWLASTGGKVDIYRDGVKIVSAFTDGGSYHDYGRTLGVTYVYQVCNVGYTGPSQCSNTWSITF